MDAPYSFSSCQLIFCFVLLLNCFYLLHHQSKLLSATKGQSVDVMAIETIPTKVISAMNQPPCSAVPLQLCVVISIVCSQSIISDSVTAKYGLRINYSYTDIITLFILLKGKYTGFEHRQTVRTCDFNCDLHIWNENWKFVNLEI